MAIYKRDTTSAAPPQFTPISADTVDGDDPDLEEAMRLHRLTWSD